MCDLDGFKQYHGAFGHAAGDAMLQRLGGRLAVAVDPLGSAYRLGGDEFCVLARCSREAAGRLLPAAIEALQDGGEGWHVGCSQGAVWVPSEAASESQALILAEERMHGNKATRSSDSRQVTRATRQRTPGRGAAGAVQSRKASGSAPLGGATRRRRAVRGRRRPPIHPDSKQAAGSLG